jgi:2-methylcitrate dehydratase PrpD
MAAQKGFITEDRIMEMPRGFLEVYHAQDVQAVTRDLGKDWDIATDMAIKLVPGGHSSHAAAEAAGDAARSGNVKPKDVEAIIISHPPYVATNVHPTDLIGVAHSVTYMVACAVAEGTYAWVHAAPEKVSDPVIAMLQDRVRGGDSPANAQQLERYRGAMVTVRTKAGQEFSSTVESPRGSALRGIDWVDVDTKYRTLVPIAKLSSEHVEESLRVIHDFDRVKTMAELVDQLR